MSGVAGGLVVPALLLAAMGWLVPRLLGLVWPEGVRALLLLALASTLVMLGLGVAFFVGLYAWQGFPIGELFKPGLAAGLLHFGRLALISALLWAPIMVLSVAGLPRRWVRETW